MPTLKPRKILRLRNYDYRQSGFYFVTICVKDRDNHFGEVSNDKVLLSELGVVVERYWLEIPKHFPFVKLHEYVVMPNHIHGIIEIVRGLSKDHSSVGSEDFRTLRMRDRYGNPWHGAQSRSLSSVIRGFKIGVAKWCKDNDYNLPIFQKSFYEHIIRSDESLNRIREYIMSNPFNWQDDLENKIFYDKMSLKIRKLKIRMHYDDLLGNPG